ncbi:MULTISPECIES: TetR/AcrR family transcriptional regulator [Burkholderia cepacia complex]|uniref:TetR/AcrR family transcriptional regulator n=1 Tax=Burkholderia cepacia complex TaxID=87882 RepID=UPI00064C2D1B|nr:MULTISPECIES: TetR/AcrR family transcriptional regulator [Burkholderia cepacia complex]AKM02600.1 TetR family transcriptional regulator [Burkholderia pyrrocinia]GAU05693.1 TetR family transcriptional regulator [Burkholderia stabilis]
MVRPREFDRDEALERALRVFWEKGYAATSTDDLLSAMQIGRQSLYNAFGDKRRLYVEALERYQSDSVSGHVARLTAPASAIAGIVALLLGVIAGNAAERVLGCMGVNAICEFGTADPELVELREKAGAVLLKQVVARVREGQDAGEIDRAVDAREAASFILTTMQGLQLGARAGAKLQALRATAEFAADRLRAH